MAAEITITLSERLANGNLSDQKTQSFAPTQSVALLLDKTVSVTTSEADLTTAEITTLGWCWITNLGPTNYLKYGPKSGGSMVEFGRLKVGESCLFRLAPGITFRWIADTATVTAQVRIYND
jgi:hypothetical protein